MRPPEAERLQKKIYQSMSGAKKLRIAFGLNRLVQKLHAEGLKARKEALKRKSAR